MLVEEHNQLGAGVLLSLVIAVKCSHAVVPSMSTARTSGTFAEQHFTTFLT